MRPAILHWKVMVLLLAIVIAGVSLGSALHSPQTTKRWDGLVATFHTIGINSVPPYPRMTPREQCAALKTDMRGNPAIRKIHGLRPMIRRLCAHR